MNTNAIYKSAAGKAAIMALYDKLLAQWPLPAKHEYVSTRHGRTFIIISGNATGPPLILLHGSASNSATWMGDVSEYGKQFQVYAVDIPGEPGKSDPERFSWDGPAFSEWLEDVIRGLGLTNVILGGMSLGAWAAINYAITQPERVEQLVLIVPSGIYPPRMSFIIRLVILSLLGEWGRNRIKQYIFQGTELTMELDQFLTLIGRHFRYRTGAPPLFTDEELQRLTMPAFFLAGENDVLLNTPKTAERLQEQLPDLTVKRFVEAGHATINTASLVVAFLQEKRSKRIAVG